MRQLFEIHEVGEGLWVGPCPDSPDKIRALGQRGITGLVSVQTDGDLGSLGMSWPLLWRFLMAQQIASTRHPIEDFDDLSLVRGLPDAVAAVQDMRGAGRVTYLHCTAGVNRSPTVAIAWLVQHQGQSLDSAWDQVNSRRPVMPNRAALERWQTLRKP
jgi:protein-tyrosine phosphatase